MIDSAGLVISSRLLSKRLPFKALLPLNGTPCIIYLCKRLQEVGVENIKLIVATTVSESDDELVWLLNKHNISVFRGSENSLVERYLGVSREFGLKNLIRVTADCPLLNAETVRFCLSQIKSEEFDLFSTRGVYPQGMDIELFSVDALRRLTDEFEISDYDHEHLTAKFYRHPEQFLTRYFSCPPAWNPASGPFTLDTPDDYLAVTKVIRKYNISVSETGPFYV